MLFTSCPQCSTVFRITEQALQKAGGQVRCGRCAQIFDAYAQLGENAEAAAAQRTGEHIVLESPLEAAVAAAAPGDSGAAHDTRGSTATESPAVEPEAEPTTGAAASDYEDANDLAMSEDEVEAVLEQAPPTATADVEPEPAMATPAWLLDEEPEPPARRRFWRIAAASAVALLAGQIAHHFRADLAGRPLIGRPIEAVYGALGAAIAPRWDVEQYAVIDSRALAEPNSTGRGNLVIRSRIRNEGPREQPYPYVELRLLDRWETTVGRRIFGPDDYMAANDASALMAVGTTVLAELAIVDPGPDAYGFEIDVCIEAERGFRCAADAVFN